MNKTSDSQSGGLLVGIIISLMALASIVLMLRTDAEYLRDGGYAPHWIGVCAAGLFLLFGLSIVQQTCIARGWLKRPVLSAALVTALIFTCFGIVLSWAALGNGNLRSYVSLPLVGEIDFPAGEYVGRFLFLLVAVPIDCGAVLCWFSLLRRKKT